jgi:hypothetical protein
MATSLLMTAGYLPLISLIILSAEKLGIEVLSVVKTTLTVATNCGGSFLG